MRVRIWIVSIALFLIPSGSAIGADLLYVSISGDPGRIATFDVSLGSGTAIAASAATFATIYSGDEFGTILRGLAFDSSGNLYVGVSEVQSLSNGMIRKYDPAGFYQSSMSSNLYRPYGIAFDTSGNLYAANNIGIINDVPYGRISKYDSSGAFLGFIGDSSSVPLAYGLAIDSSGNLYASVYGNSISKFDSSGNFLGTIGNSSNLNGPYGLAIDSSGYLYAANSTGNTISRFSPSGSFLGTIGNASNLSAPQGLSIDSKGNLYVANTNTRTISKFDSSGQFVLSWSTGAYSPNFLAFHPVPEPTTYVMSVIGAVTLGILARCRHRTSLTSDHASMGISIQ